MMESQFSPALVGEHLGILARRNIDGVVLFGFTGISEEMLTPWRESMVLLARDAPGFASVCYDDNGAVNMLMQRLYDGGHRHISFLGVPHSDVTTGQRRHQAYLNFCEQHQLIPSAALPGLAMKQGYENVAGVLTPIPARWCARPIPSPSAPASICKSNALDICRSPASAVRR